MIVSSQWTRQIVESMSRIHSNKGGPSVGAPTNLERKQGLGMKWHLGFGVEISVGAMVHSHVGCIMIGPFLID